LNLRSLRTLWSLIFHFEGKPSFTLLLIIMNFQTLSTSIRNIDQQELMNNFMVLGALTAVIIGEMYQQLRKVKFSTPYQLSDWFYFGVNLTRHCDKDDERFGVAIKDYYLGLYGQQLCWGQLDEKGCL